MTPPVSQADVERVRTLKRLAKDAGGSLEMALEEVLEAFEIKTLNVASRERLNCAFEAGGVTTTPSVLLVRRHRSSRITISATEGKPRRSFVRLPLRLVLGASGTLLLTSLLVAVLEPDRLVSRFLWSATNFSWRTPSSCEDTGWLKEIDAEANAFYKFDAHPPEHTVDDDKNTAWRQRLRGTDNDVIVWALSNSKPDHSIKLICVRNGWTESSKRYIATGRVREYELHGSRDGNLVRGSCDTSGTLREDRSRFTEFMSVPFTCKADAVRLNIRSTYKGSAGKGDVAISEVRFYG